MCVLYMIVCIYKYIYIYIRTDHLTKSWCLLSLVLDTLSRYVSVKSVWPQVSTIVAAIQMGYRTLDTALIYGFLSTIWG